MSLESRILKIRRRLDEVDPRQLASLHEAGHAVIGWMLGQSVRHPGLVVDEEGNGHAHLRSDIVMPRSCNPPGFTRMFDAANKMNIAMKVAGYAA